MTIKTVAAQHPLGVQLGKYSHVTQPLAVGLFAILVIAAAILLLGDAQVERSVVRNAGADHERDLLRFTQSLHYSGLSLSGPEADENLPALAQSSVFDANVKRALFGLRAERLDLYSLNGQAIYSTEGTGELHSLSGTALEAFETARAGQFTSFLRGSSASQQEVGRNSELLQSFALVRDVPPDSVETGSSLMVAAITVDISNELDAAYATLWLVVGVFFLGSLVILLVVHWASVRSRARLQAANDELARQYVAVKESRERMIAAADSTKRAIAEELHGSVQTRIFSLWTRLSQIVNRPIDASEERAELSAIADELDDIRENDIRGLSHRLHPSIVRVGAIPALKSLCSRLSGDLHIELHVDGAATELEPPGASPIPEPVRLAVFRIAELAIGNTIRHASASRCEVFWKYSESEQALRLIVEDDGVGFDPAKATKYSSGGLGIVNIQDYSDSINGTTIVKSEPGWGTTLTVTIPFVPGQDVAATSSSESKVVSRTEPKLPANVTPFDQQKAA